LIVGSSVIYLYLAALTGGPFSHGLGAMKAKTVVTASTSEVSKYITEYSVGTLSTPNAIASDEAGDIWFTLGRPPGIGELNSANGTLHEFLIQSSNTSKGLLSWGIAVGKEDGRVWFTDQFGNAVWSFDVRSRTFTEHPLPHALSNPYQLAEDNRGNIWFTETDGNRLGEISANGTLHEFPIPLGAVYNVYSKSVGPAGVDIGRDGTIWFAEVYANSVGSFRGGKFYSFDLSNDINSPTGIGIDARGNLWMAEHGESFIAKFDPASNSLTTFSTSNIDSRISLPYFIKVSPDGNIWFNEHYGNAIGEFVPSNGSLIEYRIPTRITSAGNISGALTMTLSPSGSPWFTEFLAGKIGTIDTSRASTLLLSLADSASSNTYSIESGGNISLKVSIKGSGNLILRSAVGGDGTGLVLRFSPSSGSGDLTSTLLISATSSTTPNAVYTVTISVASRDLVASRIILLKT